MGEVLLPSRALMNRATDGDSVALRLLPHSQWVSGSRAAGRIQSEPTEDDGANEGMNNNEKTQTSMKDKKPTVEPLLSIPE